MQFYLIPLQKKILDTRKSAYSARHGVKLYLCDIQPALMFRCIVDHKILDDIKRNGALQGIGKPELLKHDRSGLYSRQIDETNRLIYNIGEA